MFLYVDQVFYCLLIKYITVLKQVLYCVLLKYVTVAGLIMLSSLYQVHCSSWIKNVFITSLSTLMWYDQGFHDNSSTDISSTTLRLQTFRLLLYTSVQDCYTSNFCFSKSLFSSIPTSTYTMIPFYPSHFH